MDSDSEYLYYHFPLYFSYENLIRNKRKESRSRLIYQVQQIFNKHFNSVLRQFTCYSLSLDTGLIIVSIYTLIQNNDPFLIPLLLSIIPGIVLVTEFSISQMCKLQELSLRCRATGLNRNQIKVDTLYWKSCRPIVIWAGGLFCYEHREFVLKLFGSIILESVINMLITFR